ncbi:CFDP2 protein, partial [Acromyrmex charruanus]
MRRIFRLDTVGAKYRIASCNIRSLLITGKLANAVKEINRMKIDILGISKSRWTNNGACHYKGSIFYYSGRTDGQHRNGVGILVRNTVKKYVKNVVAYSDRIIMHEINVIIGDFNAKVGNRRKSNERKYKEIHQKIRQEIKIAKTKWLNEQCKEIEAMHALHDFFYFHKKLKEITNTFKKISISPLKKNNKILIDAQDLRNT